MAYVVFYWSSAVLSLSETGGEKVADLNPTFREELGHRINVASQKYRNKTEAAKAAGVSLEQFNKWIAGSVKVPLEGLKALASNPEVDFNWLATGQTSAPARVEVSIKTELLSELINLLETFLDETGTNLPVAKKAQALSLMYEFCAEEEAENREVDMRNVIRFAKLAG